MNLYEFVANRAIDQLDYLGLFRYKVTMFYKVKCRPDPFSEEECGKCPDDVDMEAVGIGDFNNNKVAAYADAVQKSISVDLEPKAQKHCGACVPTIEKSDKAPIIDRIDIV